MLGLTTLARRFGLKEHRIWRQFFGIESWSGKSITPDTAMQVATFWACVRLIAETVATLPLGLYTKADDGGRHSRSDHALYVILHDSPNADQTAVEFWEAIVACVCIWGNAYAEIVRRGDGGVAALLFLRPDLMTVYRDQHGAIRYRYADCFGEREFASDDIFHVRGFGMGGDLGLSPLTYARQTLGTAIATDEAAARAFANGMRPGGFFTYEGKQALTPEQRAQARTVLVDPYQGAENAGKIGILEAAAGFKWQDVAIPPKDAELLLTRQWHVEEICRVFRVPPVLVGHAANGVTAWGTGIESLMLGWLTLGLRPYLTRLEQAIKRWLISPADRSTVYAEFNVEGLMRADSEGRAKLYGVLAQNGVTTRNEIRARENLSRMPGGDVLTVQAALVPLDQLGPLAAARAMPPIAQPQEPVHAA